jgi:phosphoribosylamine--glycine ligase
MGSYSPVAGYGVPEVEEILDLVHRPVIGQLAERGTPFIGALFAGLMVTEEGPKVLEFNCRFGDPETQSLMPRLEGDLLACLLAAANGELGDAELPAAENAAVTVVLAAGDYPQAGDTGSPIRGIADAEATGAVVFHAGTALRDDRVITNGGRILNVSSVGRTVGEARERAYAAVDRISFPGMRFRSDIAAVTHV